MIGRFDNIFEEKSSVATKKEGRFDNIFIDREKESIPAPITKPYQPGVLGDVKAFVSGDVSVKDVAKEIVPSTAKVIGGISKTLFPAIIDFFKTTGSIFGEGLAYTIDPLVREQYKAGNLDILPTITETTLPSLAKKTVAAGIETAVYRSFPNLLKVKILQRGGIGALQGVGFAISSGLAEDKTPEEIVKDAALYGVPAAVIAIIAPHLIPLLKVEMKALPSQMKGVFKGLQGEVKEEIRKVTTKKLTAGEPVLSLPAPKEEFSLVGKPFVKTPEVIVPPQPRERLLLTAGIRPTSSPLKVPIYKKVQITKNTVLEKGDIVSIEGVDKFVVTEIKKPRVTPRGKEQIVELKDIKGNVTEESVFDLTGATQIKKTGERVIAPPKPAVQPKEPAPIPKATIKTKDVTPPVAEAPAIPKELEPLAIEARKFNTAEEFVKAQGKIKSAYTKQSVDDYYKNFANTEASRGFINEGKLLDSQIDSIRKGEHIIAQGENSGYRIYISDFEGGILKKPKIFVEDKTTGQMASEMIWLRMNESQFNLTDIQWEQLPVIKKAKLEIAFKLDSFYKNPNELVDLLKEDAFNRALYIKSLSKSQLTDFFNQAKVITKAIPEEKIAPVKRITKVPEEQLPVGEGKVKTSRLEARIKGILDDVDVKKAEDSGLTTFKQMNKAEQIQKAVAFVEKDVDEAMAVLRGEKPAPSGLLHNSIAIALEQKAITSADSNLTLKLASLRSTRAGQEISILTEADPSNPITQIQEIIKARAGMVVRKAGVKVEETRVLSEANKFSSKVATEAQKAVKAGQLKIEEAQKILNDIVC